MRRMLVSRLSRRVLVEHHIALSDALAARSRPDDAAADGGCVGIIWTELDVKNCVDKCIHWLKERKTDIQLDGSISPAQHPAGQWPEVVVEGHFKTKFSYIREHLE